MVLCIDNAEVGWWSCVRVDLQAYLDVIPSPWRWKAALPPQRLFRTAIWITWKTTTNSFKRNCFSLSSTVFVALFKCTKRSGANNKDNRMFVTFLRQPFVCDKWQHEHKHTDNVVTPYETMYFCTVRLLMKLSRIYSTAPVSTGNRF
jgi:hypothetical protein